MNSKIGGLIAMLRSALFTVLAVALLAPSARAQAVATAEIDGVVTDVSGAVVPNAHIRAVQVEKQLVRVADSDIQGRYSLPGLPVGSYTLEVKADGFKSY